MRRLLFASIVWVNSCLAASLMNLVLAPAPDLSGPAGATLTWQLSIENDDPIHYLQLDGFTALAPLDVGQGFEDPAAFSFPVVAPSTTEVDGFYSITWLSGATPGYGTSGSFQIQSSFCDDNASTNCQSNPDVLLPYSAAVEDVPEPSTAWLISAAMVLWGCRTVGTGVGHPRQGQRGGRRCRRRRPRVCTRTGAGIPGDRMPLRLPLKNATMVPDSEESSTSHLPACSHRPPLIRARSPLCSPAPVAVEQRRELQATVFLFCSVCVRLCAG